MRWEDVLGKFNGRRNEDYVKRMGGEIPGDGEGTGGRKGIGRCVRSTWGPPNFSALAAPIATTIDIEHINI